MPIMATVKVGDNLELQPGAEMKNFTSPTLKKTFDSVIFSGGPVSKGAPTDAGKAMTMPSGRHGMGPKDAIAPPAAGNKPANEIKPSAIVLAGKVMETKNVGTYTYILLEKDGKRGWSAVPTTAIKVGDDIEILPGLEMGLYTSPSTKETFENIYFSSGVKGIAPTAAAPAMQPGGMPAGHPALPKYAVSAAKAPDNQARIKKGRRRETFACLSLSRNVPFCTIAIKLVTRGGYCPDQNSVHTGRDAAR
jgi:hypothetical protein